MGHSKDRTGKLLQRCKIVLEGYLPRLLANKRHEEASEVQKLITELNAAFVYRQVAFEQAEVQRTKDIAARKARSAERRLAKIQRSLG